MERYFKVLSNTPRINQKRKESVFVVRGKPKRKVAEASRFREPLYPPHYLLIPLFSGFVSVGPTKTFQSFKINL